MTESETVIGVSAVAVQNRAVLIEGPPGSGKSSLALSLIDRGASLIGDDGVSLRSEGNFVIASPPPNISGKLEIRGVGIVEMKAVSAPLSLILTLDQDAPRFPDPVIRRKVLGTPVPVLKFRAGDVLQALRAEWALRTYALDL